VKFWTRIYSEVDTQQGLLHDRNNLGVVYETLNFDVNLWHPAREAKIRARRAHFAAILQTLASGKRTGLDTEEQRVLSLWPEDVTAQRLRQAAGDIRFQLGQSDRFRRGLVRSGAWEPHMRELLEQMGLPEQIAALPHVESSFNPDAYSRVGAAGIWQFTRLTGKRFMRVDHIIDERMDPFTATEAAGRLLKLNHSVTNDWGLAITAYNHGLAGIRRAARTVGSEDIGDIIARYEGRNWGFASRNFYPAFLAAVEVDENASRYFGDIQRAAPLRTRTVELPFYTSIDALQDAFDVDRATLKELNRGLLAPVWAGKKYVPRGYAVRLPAGNTQATDSLLAKVPNKLRFFAQIPDRFHTVARGESLSVIGARYGISVRELMLMNSLRSPDQIRAGATLRLPVHGPDMTERETWRVTAGDTLSTIAAEVGMGTHDLAAANGLSVDSVLQPGDVLRVDGLPAASLDTPSPQPASPADIPAALSLASAGNRPTMPEPDVAATITRLGQQASTALEPFVKRSRQEAPLVADAGPDPEGTEPDLSADPSDYSVADDGSIEIQATETLGHYAEWLNLRASDLRRINNLRYGTPLVIGERLALSFEEIDRQTFEKRRRSYHSDLQGAFFESHHIAGATTYRIRPGDSLWSLTEPRTDIPSWLMRQYNPDVDFSRLRPGDELQKPVIETRH
jgi:membrane-bound lytic murein transglycosylase D